MSSHKSTVAMTKLIELWIDSLSNLFSGFGHPCDFFLFPNLRTWLGGKKFSSNGSHCRHQWVFCRVWDSLLQMTIKHELCVLSGWNLAWRGSKSGSFEMSRHQMDCSAFHGNLPNLSNDPRIVAICLFSTIYQLSKIRSSIEFAKRYFNKRYKIVYRVY